MRNVLLFFSIILISSCSKNKLAEENRVEGTDFKYRCVLEQLLSCQNIPLFDPINDSIVLLHDIPNLNESACIIIPEGVCLGCLKYQIDKIVEVSSQKNIKLVVICESNNLREMLNIFSNCCVFSNDAGFTFADEIVPTGPVMYKYQNGAFICGFVLKVNQNEPIEMFFSQCFK